MIRNTRADGLELSGATVVVVGGARTGLSTARFLAGRGCRVTLTDMSDLAGKQAELSDLRDLGVVTDLGRHDRATFLAADLIVLSPGVPLFMEPLAEAKKKGVRIIGEVELAFRFFDTPVIAVTGTNGKTTTTALLGKILESCGKAVLVGGNIGTPLIEFVPGPGEDAPVADFIVAEISSFQLEAVETFAPRVALLLNITPDHLDRYRSYEEYIAAKLEIFVHQKSGDIAVLNRDDELVISRTKAIAADTLYFSRLHKESNGVWYDGKQIVCTINGTHDTYDPRGSRLTGVHNIENIMAAVAGAASVGCGGEAVQGAIRQFVPHAHRLQHVLTTSGGVSFFDDSKATNVGAALKSIESFDGGLHIILGGVDKGGSYAPMKEALKKRAKGLYLIGEASTIIERELSGTVPIVAAGTMEQAVRIAGERAKPGDTVLLAPACSSFDQYRSYQARGEDFIQHVMRYFGNGKQE
jgi:UDP-N-acetylmuramoylalanine--D-glutamate ligase